MITILAGLVGPIPATSSFQHNYVQFGRRGHAGKIMQTKSCWQSAVFFFFFLLISSVVSGVACHYGCKYMVYMIFQIAYMPYRAIQWLAAAGGELARELTGKSQQTASSGYDHRRLVFSHDF